MPTATKAMKNFSEPLKVNSNAVSFCKWITGLAGMVQIEIHAFRHTSRNLTFHFVPLGQKPPDTGLIIHEDHWHRKSNIVRSRILSVLGANKKIPGKRTVVIHLTAVQMNDFLQNHHLHGPVKAKVRLGLVYEGACVAVAAFGKPCTIHRGEQVLASVEFVRFCTISGFNVTGGLHKLMSHYLKTRQPEDIMSSVDLEWSEGRGFQEFGFREIGRTLPVTFLVNTETFERLGPSRFTEEMKQCLNNPHPQDTLSRLGFVMVQNRGNIKFAYP